MAPSEPPRPDGAEHVVVAGLLRDVVGEPFGRVLGRDLVMQAWTVDRRVGESSNRAADEHDALAWLTADELRGLRLADPRLLPLVRAALAPPAGGT